MSPILLLPHLKYAFEQIFNVDKDGELFSLGTNGISEQTLTFRLGYYLQGRFPNHHVDCEYNRYKDQLKNDVYVDQKWMKPDIIVHRRRQKGENLLVIEAKKTATWNAGWDRIEQKLIAFTRRGRYQYRLGLAWKIAKSENPARHAAIWFFGGKEILRTRLDNFDGELAKALADYA